ncbi:hypothetical protein ACCD09_31390, partial [Variovorax sp. Varisp62]
MTQRRLAAAGAALLASALLAACGSMGGKPSTAVELVPTGAITPNPTRGPGGGGGRGGPRGRGGGGGGGGGVAGAG